MRRAFDSTAGAPSLGVMLLAIGCSQDATAPGDLGEISLLVISGGGQYGVVGTNATSHDENRRLTSGLLMINHLMAS